MKKITSFFLAASLFGACQSPQTSAENKESAPTEQKTQEVEKNATPVEISKTILIGKFSPSETKGFVSVPSEYCSKPMHIQEEVLNAYLKMRTAALAEGVNLQIISGTRTFYDQKAIWERKWETNFAETKDSLATANKILLFSSMPGTSRHHWGTDIDLNSLEDIYFQSGEGLKIYNWLKAHAGEFGFCQTYSDKVETNRTGYSMEKWHWSYMPLSSKYLSAYVSTITYADIKGFKGDNLPERIGVIQNYVQGISGLCK
jgi:LAS superfamily LD-carboxypeptidase LdcB